MLTVGDARARKGCGNRPTQFYAEERSLTKDFT